MTSFGRTVGGGSRACSPVVKGRRPFGRRLWRGSHQAAAATGRAVELEHPFLERGGPLAQISACARAAGGSRGRTVLVIGEAGAGKSTLLRAFEAQAVNFAFLHGACEDLSIAEPLGPLYDLTRAVGIDLDAMMHPESERLAVFGSVLDQIEVPDRSVILMIEDVHWADEATLDFIRFAARRLHDRRLLLVMTARDSETEGRPRIRRALGGVPSADVTRIHLQPLSEAAVAHLAAGSDRQAKELHRITGGNAFYVTELLRGADSDGLRSVQDAVLDRLGRLSAPSKCISKGLPSTGDNNRREGVNMSMVRCGP